MPGKKDKNNTLVNLCFIECKLRKKLSEIPHTETSISPSYTRGLRHGIEYILREIFILVSSIKNKIKPESNHNININLTGIFSLNPNNSEIINDEFVGGVNMSINILNNILSEINKKEEV